MNALDFLAATDEIAGAAAHYLRTGGRKVGLTGFCLGGIVSILGAIRLVNIDAASAYYGAPDDALDDAELFVHDLDIASKRGVVGIALTGGRRWYGPATGG